MPFLRPASEKCQQEKRKTVNGEDILFAMGSLGFENYAEALKIYLTRYREVGASISYTLLVAECQKRRRYICCTFRKQKLTEINYGTTVGHKPE